MRSALAALLLATLTLTAGCATSKEIELRLRVAELEKFIAGAQDDNAMLMKALAEQQGYIRALEAGAQWQAGEMARIRENCEL